MRDCLYHTEVNSEYKRPFITGFLFLVCRLETISELIWPKLKKKASECQWTGIK